MKRLALSAVVCAAPLVGGAAHAADYDIMPTKAPLYTKAPATPQSCRDVPDFFLTSCQLSYYGVRFYGTIDMGGAYQTHGAPFNPDFTTGASYFLQKMNRQRMFGIAPSGLGQSNVGVQIKEPLSAGWSFVAQLEAGIDPYSMRFASSPAALVSNTGVPVNQQSTNGDSSRAGQFYNGLGFMGVSSDTYGTLTVFRQNALTADGVAAYDPMANSYAFSPIGFSGTVAGGGDTENAKYSTSVKYRVNIANFRAAAIWQFGGYELNNGTKGAWGGQIGADFKNFGPGVLAVDAIVEYNRDAVNLTLSGAPTNLNGVPIGTMLPQTLTATLSNNTSVMLLAKYTIDKLKLYGGYEWMQFASPSDPITSGGFNDIQGTDVCINCATATDGTNINNTAYSGSAGFKDKVLQVFWAGARYSIREDLDVVGAYYHYSQNDFAASAANQAFCTTSSSSKNFCTGSMDAVSALIDWKFAPKWDTYIGTMLSEMNGGLANGYLARQNLATTAGVRFRF